MSFLAVNIERKMLPDGFENGSGVLSNFNVVKHRNLYCLVFCQSNNQDQVCLTCKYALTLNFWLGRSIEKIPNLIEFHVLSQLNLEKYTVLASSLILTVRSEPVKPTSDGKITTLSDF